jgi:ribosomal protein S20
MYNRSVKSRVKTYIRYFSEIVEKAADDLANLATYKAEAEEKLKKAVSELHRAVTKGIIQRTTAGRKVGRLTVHFGKLFKA